MKIPSLKFPGRMIKPYGEGVSASELRKGAVYFMFSYLDTDQAVPELKPIVFNGDALPDGTKVEFWFEGPSEGPEFIFEKYDSRIHGINTSRKPKAKYVAFDKNSLNGVYEYEKALNLLMLCSLRRQKKGLT